MFRDALVQKPCWKEVLGCYRISQNQEMQEKLEIPLEWSPPWKKVAAAQRMKHGRVKGMSLSFPSDF